MFLFWIIARVAPAKHTALETATIVHALVTRIARLAVITADLGFRIVTAVVTARFVAYRAAASFGNTLFAGGARGAPGFAAYLSVGVVAAIGATVLVRFIATSIGSTILVCVTAAASAARI